MSEAAALVALAASLAAAVARPRWAPDWAVASLAAAALAIGGVLSGHEASAAVRHLGPTVGFLAALLVLAYGCRRAGLFDALGRVMVAGARGRPRRLLAMVFLAAAGTTAVLSLDATVVLLTPIVFATAARLPTSSRPHMYACTHLANSSSLVLPVSNLTNLLAFQALSISFVRFGGLMALPWLAALAVEWAVLSRVFRSELPEPAHGTTERSAVDVAGRVPLFPLGVLGATLVGFGFSSLIGIAPAWFAGAGALVLVVRERISLPAVVRSAEPTFLIFVLALGLVVRAAGDHGLSSFVDSLVPHGTALPQLLAIAGISAVVANLLNNLPATLILLPVAAASGPGGALAMLIGVNVGPNLTYTGSLATLLWRRVVHAHAEATDLSQFTRLGLLTVPPALAACTICLWLALQVVK
ncbi:MAG TPA: SLC13 family permease [Solirubrobacteraceae bacterium]|nr:SLC13 family permease [Solirubrobacteraceae bacterium]